MSQNIWNTTRICYLNILLVHTGRVPVYSMAVSDKARAVRYTFMADQPVTNEIQAKEILREFEKKKKERKNIAIDE